MLKVWCSIPSSVPSKQVFVNNLFCLYEVSPSLIPLYFRSLAVHLDRGNRLIYLQNKSLSSCRSVFHSPFAILSLVSTLLDDKYEATHRFHIFNIPLCWLGRALNMRSTSTMRITHFNLSTLTCSANFTVTKATLIKFPFSCKQPSALFYISLSYTHLVLCPLSHFAPTWLSRFLYHSILSSSRFWMSCLPSSLGFSAMVFFVVLSNFTHFMPVWSRMSQQYDSKIGYHLLISFSPRFVSSPILQGLNRGFTIFITPFRSSKIIFVDKSTWAFVHDLPGVCPSSIAKEQYANDLFSNFKDYHPTSHLLGLSGRLQRCAHFQSTFITLLNCSAEQHALDMPPAYGFLHFLSSFWTIVYMHQRIYHFPHPQYSKHPPLNNPLPHVAYNCVYCKLQKCQGVSILCFPVPFFTRTKCNVLPCLWKLNLWTNRFHQFPLKNHRFTSPDHCFLLK